MKIIKYIIEATFIYFLFFVVKIIGLEISRKLLTLLFSKIGFIFKSKNVVEKNIRNVFKDISKDKFDEITKFMWKNYACIFVEYIFLYKYRLGKFRNPQIKITGQEVLDDILKSKRQVIFISGHFGNFELMALELEKYKIDLAAIYRPLNNFFLNPFMVYLRKKYICKKQIEKGKKGTRKVLELMKKNMSVALMVDQRLGESERFPFFRKPAHTTTLPAQLALKFNCDIVPIYLQRNENNTFTMDILKPMKIKKTDDVENNKREITIQINQIIEKMILKNPKQWIWTHNRWK